MLGLRTRDELAVFDSLLEDKKFWAAFEEELQNALLPQFLSSVIAGMEVGLRLKPRKVEKAYPIPVDPQLSPDDIERIAIESIRDYLPKFTKDISLTTYEGVKDAVLRSRRDGTGTPGVIRDILPLFGSKRSELIGITETTRLMGLGAQAAYRAQGINGWEWMTAEDRMVDTDCASRQGEIYSIDVNFEPAHPRCRCFPSPALIDDPKKIPSPASLADTTFVNGSDAQVHLSAKYPNIDFRLSSIHPSNINAVAHEFDRLATRYPQIAERLQQFGTAGRFVGPKYERAYAMANIANGRYISLNPRWFSADNLVNKLKADNLVNRGSAKNPLFWSTADDLEGIIAHEWGHLLDGYMLGWGEGATAYLSPEWATWQAFSRQRARLLSKYAQADGRERLAEGFAQMERIDKSKWNPYTRKLADLLESFQPGEE